MNPCRTAANIWHSGGAGGLLLFFKKWRNRHSLSSSPQLRLSWALDLTVFKGQQETSVGNSLLWWESSCANRFRKTVHVLFKYHSSGIRCLRTSRAKQNLQSELGTIAPSEGTRNSRSRGALCPAQGLCLPVAWIVWQNHKVIKYCLLCGGIWIISCFQISLKCFILSQVKSHLFL